MILAGIIVFSFLSVGEVWGQRSRAQSRSQQPVQCVPGRTQFPNPNDRHSFYKCDAGGNPVLFPCPAGTWFNPRLEVCDWDTQSSSGQTSRPSSNNGNNGNIDRPSSTNTPRPNSPNSWNNTPRPNPQNSWNNTPRPNPPNSWTNTPRPTSRPRPNPWDSEDTPRPNNNNNNNGNNIPSSPNWWSRPAEGESGNRPPNNERPGTSQRPSSQQPGTSQQPAGQRPGSSQQPAGQQPGRDQQPVEGGSCDPLGPLFLPDPSNCNAFFMCPDGLLERSSCSPGQYYNPDRARCGRDVPSGCDLPEEGEVWA